MPSSAVSARTRLALALYSTLWYAALPPALVSKRMRPGLMARIRPPKEPKPADVWIQAASTGECHLAKTLLENWPAATKLACAVTTNTPQGMQVLQEFKPPEHMLYTPAYAPLDTKRAVRKAMRAYRPRVLVLLETELWPQLLAACKAEGVPVLLLNARMSAQSLSFYSRMSWLWSELGPDRILAVSQDQAQRYVHLFPTAAVDTMRNMKFDRCSTTEGPLAYVHNPLSRLFKAQSQLVVYGSVRRQEEPLLLEVITRLSRERPRAIQAVFPRHMHRVSAWARALSNRGLDWQLRSQTSDSVSQGTVLLWDWMGELEPAYALARAAFVGGSLAPKGGQNFLEPLAQGLTPCIGPWWSNFAWVGQDIVHQGLVTQVSSPQDLFRCLSDHLRTAPNRNKIVKRFSQYLGQRQGGVQDALAAIQSCLAGTRRRR